MPLLDSTYEFISVDSSKDDQDGIFVKKSRFHILKDELVFSESDAETPVITIVELNDKETGTSFAVANSHFSFSKVAKRGHEAALVAKKVDALAKRMPVFFMGDLNTFPNRPDMSFPFYDGDYVNDILTKKTLQDSIDVSLVGHVGPIGTFTNNPPAILPFEGTGTPGVILDHIYVSKDITVLLHAVQPGTVDGHFPSDHMPVVIDCVVMSDS
ncbi:MAG: endonuclease/exonuclease/phosphatase family protein [Verrucomicrobia bacterium]|nr:endonuclease/exonuclease/phosphatase family protein [Verrucomicrobiota bacterium]